MVKMLITNLCFSNHVMKGLVQISHFCHVWGFCRCALANGLKIYNIKGQLLCFWKKNILFINRPVLFSFSARLDSLFSPSN